MPGLKAGAAAFYRDELGITWGLLKAAELQEGVTLKRANFEASLFLHGLPLPFAKLVCEVGISQKCAFAL